MYRTDRQFAREMDAQDGLAAYRQQFHCPRGTDGRPVIYLCGNSLGLQPIGVRQAVLDELDKWADFGVEGHFARPYPWYSYHEHLCAAAAAIVGALEHEVVAMNSLTTNLHLMMVSFYRPTATRYKILIEATAFPSDQYAVASQAKFHGFDPKDAVVVLSPRDGESTLRTEDIEAYLDVHGQEVALVMFGGVNYYTGQAFDMASITAAGHRNGCIVGFDLAHAAGNLMLELHDWGVDFAVWCSYKYLNAGPGGVGGCFVHDRHAAAVDLPRFAGWWGTDPATRFQMDPAFVPQHGAEGWQLSNAMILPMAALRASLELFEAAGMPALRQKALALTEYLLFLIDQIPSESFEIITPREPAARGCQISIRALSNGRALFERLEQGGVVCDFREPDVIRVAPVPLYNSFEDVWSFWSILKESVSS
ncbi:MAG: kynureninase [Bradymonadaceae bacterium]|nr:kynureninase [Lujinxingiaceae bacterium]